MKFKDQVDLTGVLKDQTPSKLIFKTKEFTGYSGQADIMNGYFKVEHIGEGYVR